MSGKICLIAWANQVPSSNIIFHQKFRMTSLFKKNNVGKELIIFLKGGGRVGGYPFAENSAKIINLIL